MLSKTPKLPIDILVNTNPNIKYYFLPHSLIFLPKNGLDNTDPIGCAENTNPIYNSLSPILSLASTG